MTAGGLRRMVRVVIDSVVEGAIKRISAKGLVGETLVNREAMEHYGFTSRPLPGAEGIMIREGNHWVLIASDDRRYRVAIENGEVALYDDQGQVVRLERGKTVHIYGCDHLAAEAAVDAVITSPLIKAVASSQVICDTPLTACTGEPAGGGRHQL